VLSYKTPSGRIMSPGSNSLATKAAQCLLCVVPTLGITAPLLRSVQFVFTFNALQYTQDNPWLFSMCFSCRLQPLRAICCCCAEELKEFVQNGLGTHPDHTSRLSWLTMEIDTIFVALSYRESQFACHCFGEDSRRSRLLVKSLDVSRLLMKTVDIRRLRM
jgi:hypothetical protein